MARILIVDDSPTQLVSIQRIVQKLGHQTLLAQDGAIGVQVATAELPDLILMDVVMPNLNGFQATRQLQKQAETKHIPVVLITTKDQDIDRFWGLRQGARGYITKPFTEVELTEVIHNIFNKEDPSLVVDPNKEVVQTTIVVKKTDLPTKDTILEEKKNLTNPANSTVKKGNNQQAATSPVNPQKNSIFNTKGKKPLQSIIATAKSEQSSIFKTLKNNSILSTRLNEKTEHKHISDIPKDLPVSSHNAEDDIAYVPGKSKYAVRSIETPKQETSLSESVNSIIESVDTILHTPIGTLLNTPIERGAAKALLAKKSNNTNNSIAKENADVSNLVESEEVETSNLEESKLDAKTELSEEDNNISSNESIDHINDEDITNSELDIQNEEDAEGDDSNQEDSNDEFKSTRSERIFGALNFNRLGKNTLKNKIKNKKSRIKK